MTDTTRPAISAFEAIFGTLRTYAFSHTTNRIDVELGARLFRHLMALPIAYFEARRAGDSVARVRELENIMERAIALSPSAELGPEELALHRISPEEEPEAESAAPSQAAIDAPLPAYLDRLERDAILQALGKTGFNRTAAARLLGITFRQLRYRMQRLGIKDENR